MAVRNVGHPLFLCTVGNAVDVVQTVLREEREGKKRWYAISANCQLTVKMCKIMGPTLVQQQSGWCVVHRCPHQ